MFCEYCDKNLSDVAEARLHMLSMGHLRSKNSYELTVGKYFERSRQAKLHPDNFEKLCLSLNMHSDKDVKALDKEGFFKMERLWHYDVVEKLLKVLMESGIKYHMDRLHPQVRQKLIQSLAEERAAKETAQQG